MKFNFGSLSSKHKDYEICFSTPEGKRVLADLIKFSGYRESSFVPGDPHSSAFNEGMRRVILRILSLKHMDEDKITKLMKDTDYRAVNGE